MPVSVLFQKARDFQSGRFFDSRLWRIIFFLIPTLFYGLTACRTPAWLDATLILNLSKELTLNAWVNIHNLFNVIGHGWIMLFGFIDPHYALVLLASLFGALTVQMVFLIGVEISGRGLWSTIGSVVFMISHSLWWHSTTIEVYTLNSFLIALMVLGVVRFESRGQFRYLCISSFALGLGISNHVLMGLFVLPASVLLVQFALKRNQRRRKSKILLLLGLLLFGAALYIGIFLKDFLLAFGRMDLLIHQDGKPVITAFLKTLHRATGGDFKQSMFTAGMAWSERLRWWANYLLLFFINFPSPALFIGVFGFAALGRNRKFRYSFTFLILGLVVQVLWSANYFIWDMFAFSLPVYVLFGIVVVTGFGELRSRWKSAGFRSIVAISAMAIPLILYPWIARRGQEEGMIRRYFNWYPEYHQAEPFWDPIRYISNPNKIGYRELPDIFSSLFSLLPEGVHFMAGDPTTDFILRYYYRDVKNERTDLIIHSLFSPFFDDAKARSTANILYRILVSGNPVYFTSLEHPERLVLNRLLPELDDTLVLETIEAMQTEQIERVLMNSPYFTVVPLTEDGSVRLFRISLTGDFPPP